MNNMVLEIKVQTPPPTIPSSPSTNYSLNTRISPSILLIIIIIAVIFFISGLLHLLVRFLIRPSVRNSDEFENLTALQGQLQQLFHLHDSGVDQSFIDSLPIFDYKAIVGLKDPFDCAVCLSEFEVEDKLRLLPKCSHAFHVDCIDTWLLSHSTCPICRASLVQDFNQGSFSSPVVRVLESGMRENSREVDVLEKESTAVVVNINSPPHSNNDDQVMRKSCEIGEREGENCGEREVAVKLGKFRNNGGGEGGGDGGAEARRCFSMGSCAYVLDESSLLKVAITTPLKKQSLKKRGSMNRHRTAMSECGCESRREFNGFDPFKVVGDENKSINSFSRRDSFSQERESSRRAFSFRLPARRNPVDSGEGGSGGGGELEFDEEIGKQRFRSLEREDDHPSFRRTLQWIMGRAK